MVACIVVKRNQGTIKTESFVGWRLIYMAYSYHITIYKDSVVHQRINQELATLMKRLEIKNPYKISRPIFSQLPCFRASINLFRPKTVSHPSCVGIKRDIGRLPRPWRTKKGTAGQTQIGGSPAIMRTRLDLQSKWGKWDEGRVHVEWLWESSGYCGHTLSVQYCKASSRQFETAVVPVPPRCRYAF